MTVRWNYSCYWAAKIAYSVVPVVRSSQPRPTKLVIISERYLWVAIELPAVFYEFSGPEIPRANGFSITHGLGTLSCQVNGMTLDYSGPPK